MTEDTENGPGAVNCTRNGLGAVICTRRTVTRAHSVLKGARIEATMSRWLTRKAATN
jgi:hypothetical protein